MNLLRLPLLLAWRDGQLVLADDPIPLTVSSPTLDALPEAMARVLAPHRHRRLRLRIGDEHARLLHLARPRGLRSADELEAALRQHAAKLFGDDGADWTWRRTAVPGARADTACALPAALLAALRAGCRAARVHVVSLQVDWVAAAASVPRRGRAWVLNAGARSLTLGLLEGGRCDGVRRLAPPGPQDDLADVMARAQALFGARAEDAQAPVWVFGAPLAVPPGDAAARVRRAGVDTAPMGFRARMPGSAR